METYSRVMRFAVGAVAACTLVGMPAVAGGVERCRAKTKTQDGTIEVAARNVVGPLRWGAEPGLEVNQFSNHIECISNGRAKKCQLGTPGSNEARTPPDLCSIYLRDDVSQCKAYLKGCTPGVRVSSAEPPGGPEPSPTPPPAPTPSPPPPAGSYQNVPSVRLVDGVESSYTRTLKRYVVKATFDPSHPAYNTASRVVPIPQNIITDYCSDEEGCTMTLVMKDVTPNQLAGMSIGPLKWYYHPLSGRFRGGTASLAGEFGSMGEGADGDGFFDHSLRAANCYLSDSFYVVGSNNADDSGVGMYLVNHISNPAYYGDCELAITD